jgi:hypothetical protein
MNNTINIEDAVFILNMRIRMIRDMLRLDPSPEIFLEQTLNDLEFIDRTQAVFSENFIENPEQFDARGEYDYVSDLEWRFGQLLAELSGAGSPFAVSRFPEMSERIERLKNASMTRETTFAEFGGSSQAQNEPVVSSAELSELLRGL